MSASFTEHTKIYTDFGLALLPLHYCLPNGRRLTCSCGKGDCSSPAKHPFGSLAPNGLKNATQDLKEIEQWFKRAPVNIGVATGTTSGVIALDIDPRHDGDYSLAALEKHHGELPETWRFLTGGGGEHILFRHPGKPVPNSAGRIGEGIDIRGDNGYIVAPPSMHVSGTRYAISVDHHPDDVALADPPLWLLKLIIDQKSSAKIPAPASWATSLRQGVTEGKRNDCITRISGHLLGRRIDPHVCLDLMLAFNDARCQPPLSETEVMNTVASIVKRERTQKRRSRGKVAS